MFQGKDKEKEKDRDREKKNRRDRHVDHKEIIIEQSLESSRNDQPVKHNMVADMNEEEREKMRIRKELRRQATEKPGAHQVFEEPKNASHESKKIKAGGGGKRKSETP